MEVIFSRFLDSCSSCDTIRKKYHELETRAGIIMKLILAKNTKKKNDKIGDYIQVNNVYNMRIECYSFI